MLRAVVHLDADAFFASVEQASDPRLRGQPVAVGGEKRGIIASASYEARRCGIYTPMPTVRARKLCPRLVILPGDFEKYERFSRWMFSYAYDFTPDVEQTSIDEGYFDLTASRRPPVAVATTIRDAIRQALKITVSEGIASNKLVSQIASKLNKPAAMAEIPAGREVSFLHPLPNKWLPGVGPKTSTRLSAAGLAFIGQIAATPTDWLALLVGSAAPQLKDFANGLDPRPILPLSQPAKSYSQQETFAEDQTDEAFLEATLRRMADHLFAKARADTKSVRTLTVKVRYNDMDEDQVSESLLEPTDLETDVYGRLSQMLRRAWRRRVSLRLVSLKLSNLYDGYFPGELLLTDSARGHADRRRLATVIDQLRHQRGQDAILRGHDFVLPPPTGAKPATPNPKSEIRNPKEIRSPKSEPEAAFFPPLLAPRSSPLAIPLLCRSHYSFLNSTLSIPALLELARQHELPAVALCDQGNLHGAVEFFSGAKAAGLQPILGAEIPWQGRPLRLYVENQRGYTNLCRILSTQNQPESPTGEASPQTVGQASRPAGSWGLRPQENLPSLHRVPRIKDSSGLHPSSFVLSESLTEGLIAIGSEPSLAPLFPGRFYLGVEHPDELRRLDPTSRLPVIALAPVHYATPADRWKFDILQSIRTLTLLRQDHPEKDRASAFHFHPPAQLRELFRNHPGLLARANEIAQRCRFEFILGRPQFPAFKTPDGSTPRQFLHRLVQEGARRRYGDARLAQLRSQLEEELHIIATVGYEEYFLVVWELLCACRTHGIEWITRGSAADSLVCYCLGISNVCPLRFELYFRRFLNQERMALNKLPDIDIDFPHDRKDDVVDLIFARYGREHCAVVGGFNTLHARGAVGEVAKVLGVSEHQIRRFTEHFPWAGARGLRELLRAIPECRDLPLDEEPYRSALDMADFLEGVPRYPKMHPCGVVLSRQPMHELTPTFLSAKGYPTTHFDMDSIEAIGLVKMDILAQGGLAVMRDVQTLLRARGLAVDLTHFTVQTTRPANG